MRSVKSSDADTMRDPEGENAIAVMDLVCPCNGCPIMLVSFASKRRSVLSEDAATNLEPSGEKAAGNLPSSSRREELEECDSATESRRELSGHVMNSRGSDSDCR